MGYKWIFRGDFLLVQAFIVTTSQTGLTRVYVPMAFRFFLDFLFHRFRSTLFVPGCVALLLLPACTGKAPTEVAAPIADSTMIQLIIELHLAEARSQLSATSQTAKRDSIFLHYDVNADEFEAAMAYYSSNPEVYVSIYSEALDKLSDERYLPFNDN